MPRFPLMVTVDAEEFRDIIRRGGVSAWNRFYRATPALWPENQSWDIGSAPPTITMGIDLSDEDFSGMNLDGVILDGASLMNSSFRNASLRGASLRIVEATGADFWGSDLEGADTLLAIGIPGTCVGPVT